MNTKVYTITDPDEEGLDADGIRDFYWDELYVFISPHKSPKMGDRVLWVVEMGGVAQWMKLEPEMIIGDIVVYNSDIKNLPSRAKKRFLEACFNKG